MSEMREVVLHGELARRFGKNHRLAVASAAEAVRALSANFPAFEKHLKESADRGVAYQVWVGGENVGQDDLTRHSDGRIYISPVIQGSKQAGLFQTILGAILIVVGVIGNIYGGWGTPLIEAGIAMMAGGLMMMLAGVPGQDKNQNKLKSSFFDGPVNTTAQGNPVPVGYGRLIVGSAVLSAGISIDDYQIGSAAAGNGNLWNQGIQIRLP